MDHNCEDCKPGGLVAEVNSPIFLTQQFKQEILLPKRDFKEPEEIFVPCNTFTIKTGIMENVPNNFMVVYNTKPGNYLEIEVECDIGSAGIKVDEVFGTPTFAKSAFKPYQSKGWNEWQNVKREPYPGKEVSNGNIFKFGPVYWSEMLKGFEFILVLNKRASFDVLPNTYSKYFMSEKFSDILIEAGGQAFHAHRFILSETSSMFEIKHKNEMTANVNFPTIIIDKFEAKIVEYFLEFIYKGTSKIFNEKNQNEDYFVELLKLACVYKVQPLILACEEVIKAKLNGNNVIQIFKLSRYLGITTLKEAAKEFFKENKGGVFSTSEAFNEATKTTNKDILYELLF